MGFCPLLVRYASFDLSQFFLYPRGRVVFFVFFVFFFWPAREIKTPLSDFLVVQAPFRVRFVSNVRAWIYRRPHESLPLIITDPSSESDI